jgi:probable blue pigment (indigoidine) exporter
VLLFILARARRIPLPKGPAALGAAVYGLLAFGLAYALLYYALVGLTAGTTSVILASVPLLTLLFAVLHRQERLTVRGLIAGVLAILGIGVLSLGTLDAEVSSRFFVVALLGAAATAESSVVAKALPKPDPIMTNCIGMGVGSATLWIVSFAFGETWALPDSAQAWLVLGYLVFFGSVVVFILLLFVIQRWTASATVYAIALMPLVAVVLGALVAGESLTGRLFLGGALVTTGVYFGAIPGRARSRRPGDG